MRSNASPSDPARTSVCNQVGYLFLLTDPSRRRGVRAEHRVAEHDGRAEPDDLGCRGRTAVDRWPTSTMCWPRRSACATATRRPMRWSWDTRQRRGRWASASSRGCPVTGIDVDGGDITGVRTPRGTVSTSTVICVAGAWSPTIAAMAGVDLPVKPRRPTDLVHGADAEPAGARADDDRLHDRLLLPLRGSRSVVRHGRSRSARGFDAPMRPDWLEVVGEVVAHRAPRCSTWGSPADGTASTRPHPITTR